MSRETEQGLHISSQITGGLCYRRHEEISKSLKITPQKVSETLRLMLDS